MKKTAIKTSLTKIKPGRIDIRGYDIEQLIGHYSFSQVSWLLLMETLPNPVQSKMFDAILVSCIDHGVNAPSTHVARTVASCGVPVQSAISSGINAIGDFHGGAGEACAQMLQEATAQADNIDIEKTAKKIVLDFQRQGRRIPGLGHRIHNPDIRAIRLFKLAEELDLRKTHVSLIKAIQTELKKINNKDLPINIDGAIAALISDLGIHWRLGKSIFIIARTVGIAAHVDEQIRNQKPLQFAAPVNVIYDLD